jgi:hypothetical protein
MRRRHDVIALRLKDHQLLLRACTAVAVEMGIVNRQQKWQRMEVSERLANLKAIPIR